MIDRRTRRSFVCSYINLRSHDGIDFNHIIIESEIIQERSGFAAKRTGLILIERDFKSRGVSGIANRSRGREGRGTFLQNIVLRSGRSVQKRVVHGSSKATIIA